MNLTIQPVDNDTMDFSLRLAETIFYHSRCLRTVENISLTEHAQILNSLKMWNPSFSFFVNLFSRNIQISYYWSVKRKCTKEEDYNFCKIYSKSDIFCYRELTKLTENGVKTRSPYSITKPNTSVRFLY